MTLTVNAPNAAEPLCSNRYSSNNSKHETFYSNLKEFFSSEFHGSYGSDSVIAQSTFVVENETPV